MEDHLVADIEVLHSMKEVVLRGRTRDTMSADQSTCNREKDNGSGLREIKCPDFQD